MTARQDGPVRTRVQVPGQERIVSPRRQWRSARSERRGVRSEREHKSLAAFALLSFLTPLPSLLFSMHPVAAALARRGGLVVLARALLQHHRLHFRLGRGFGLPVLVHRM